MYSYYKIQIRIDQNLLVVLTTVHLVFFLIYTTFFSDKTTCSFFFLLGLIIGFLGIIGCLLYMYKLSIVATPEHYFKINHQFKIVKIIVMILILVQLLLLSKLSFNCIHKSEVCNVINNFYDTTINKSDIIHLKLDQDVNNKLDQLINNSYPNSSKFSCTHNIIDSTKHPIQVQPNISVYTHKDTIFVDTTKNPIIPIETTSIFIRKMKIKARSKNR